MGMIDDFIDRKHGRKEVIYDLPELKELLEETYGVMVYQEQVMQISNRIAGYSLGDADLLRRAMGKKKVEEMQKQRERFLQGASERKHPRKKAEKVFDLMEKFAGYGFNKSHSAAYAYLAVVTAYLKAHYALEFISALLTSETGNTAKVVKYISECREMGIQVLAPDVNWSEFTFTPVHSDKPGESGIRFGLGAIKNVGFPAVESIVKAREEGGPFKSVYEFCERVDLSAVNRRMIESLIRAGAMDNLGGTRAQQFAVLDAAIENGLRVSKDKASGQSGLFADLFAAEPVEHPLPNVPDWTSREKLSAEKEMLGFYITGHPLDEYDEKATTLATHLTSGLEGLARSTEVALCGILTSINRRRNKKGELWASLQIEDREGNLEAMVFAKQFESLNAQLVEDKAVLVRGLVYPEENAPPKISVQEIVPLENARIAMPSLISIRVPMTGKADASALHELFARKPGKTEVRLRLEKSKDFSVILDVAEKVRPDKEFKTELARICGPEALEVLASE
jgi:DNA polymerase-3 subunit alpha